MHLIYCLKNASFKENIVNVDWGKLSRDFPDDIPTMHTNPTGHKIVADTILKKFEQNGWK